MYAVDFNPENNPSSPADRTRNDSYLWWVSDETYDRLFDEALASGYLQQELSHLREEASWYKGLTSSAGTLLLLDGFERRAQELIEQLESTSGLDIMDSHFLSGLRDLIKVWQRLADDKKIHFK
ncbi:hypothetical protein BH683_000725 [Williamsia sp. 1138]|uniref:Uncharacterized protein n=1 Tax=Gordonia rubripertincta TaxID=36822 RepID=A0ABT4MP11_GORRU|nr:MULTISPECIES: hypothetical protein [Mycobacteriales]MCZ4548410.1 hypothetical protein [Gordonia rubripertincta]OZG31119.1 hypothetical protein BH683_000725 [Williamsia sp. 1138]